MIQRIAVTMALLAFIICLVAGGVEAGNTFATTVWRALLAMGATLVIGLVVGAMAKRMLDENLSAQQEKLEKSSAVQAGRDR